MTPAALTPTELNTFKTWVHDDTTDCPVSIRALAERLIALYENLAHDKKQANDLLKTLRMAMGITPTSERGKQLLSKR